MQQFFRMTEIQKYKTPQLSHEKLEKLIWEPSSFEPVYGTNTSHRLMNSPIFNFGILNTILDDLPDIHEGNTLYLIHYI